jgi:hypothetical protein
MMALTISPARKIARNPKNMRRTPEAIPIPK